MEFLKKLNLDTEAELAFRGKHLDMKVIFQQFWQNRFCIEICDNNYYEKLVHYNK